MMCDVPSMAVFCRESIEFIIIIIIIIISVIKVILRIIFHVSCQLETNLLLEAHQLLVLSSGILIYLKKK
jgi:hypothetical protein